MSNIAEEIQKSGLGPEVANLFATIGKGVRERRQQQEAKSIVEELLNKSMTMDDMLSEDFAKNMALTQTKLGSLGEAGTAASKTIESMFENATRIKSVQNIVNNQERIRIEKEFDNAVRPLSMAIENYNKNVGTENMTGKDAQAIYKMLTESVNSLKNQSSNPEWQKMAESVGLGIFAPQDIGPMGKLNLDAKKATIDLAGGRLDAANAKAQLDRARADITKTNDEMFNLIRFADKKQDITASMETIVSNLNKQLKDLEDPYLLLGKSDQEKAQIQADNKIEKGKIVEKINYYNTELNKLRNMGIVASPIDGSLQLQKFAGSDTSLESDTSNVPTLTPNNPKSQGASARLRDRRAIK